MLMYVNEARVAVVIILFYIYSVPLGGLSLMAEPNFMELLDSWANG